MSLIFFRRAQAALSVLVLWHGELMLAHAQESASAWANMLALEKVAGVGPCQAVEADGSRLYATGRGLFHVPDIFVVLSDLRRPRHLGMLKTGEAQSCWAREGLLYIGDWASAAGIRTARPPRSLRLLERQTRHSRRLRGSAHRTRAPMKHGIPRRSHPIDTTS